MNNKPTLFKPPQCTRLSVQLLTSEVRWSDATVWDWEAIGDRRRKLKCPISFLFGKRSSPQKQHYFWGFSRTFVFLQQLRGVFNDLVVLLQLQHALAVVQLQGNNHPTQVNVVYIAGHLLPHAETRNRLRGLLLPGTYFNNWHEYSCFKYFQTD